MKKVLLLFVIIICIINLPPVKWMAGPDDVYYSNVDGSFTFNEYNTSGRDYELCLRNFQVFKETENHDTTLYRITPKNILKIWRWGDYLTKDKYKLPYKSWEEIQTKRGPIKNKTNWQAF
jgi:hypothetical protein